MTDIIGKKVWVIAEGNIPGYSTGKSPEFTSHETACILNTNEQEAGIVTTIYYSGRESAGPYRVLVPGKRTKHLRFNDLDDPEKIPVNTDCSSVFISSVPIVVQYTRFDSRQAENALLTTIAYSQ